MVLGVGGEGGGNVGFEKEVGAFEARQQRALEAKAMSDEIESAERRQNCTMVQKRKKTQ